MFCKLCYRLYIFFCPGKVNIKDLFDVSCLVFYAEVGFLKITLKPQLSGSWPVNQVGRH